jgi:hypothetical protein
LPPFHAGPKFEKTVELRGQSAGHHQGDSKRWRIKVKNNCTGYCRERESSYAGNKSSEEHAQTEKNYWDAHGFAPAIE